MKFLVMIHQEKLPMPPRTFGLAHRKTTDEISCKGFFISNQYVEPLSKALQLCKNLNVLDLSHTKLSKTNIEKLICNLPICIKSINFSRNEEFGWYNTNVLCNEILQDPRFRMETLLLEECNLGDKGTEILGRQLAENVYMRCVNISNNKIGYKGMEMFCQYFKENQYLIMLFLHWNPIGWRGGKCIAEILPTNKSLQVLDLSFCNMGVAKDHGPSAKVAEKKFRDNL